TRPRPRPGRPWTRPSACSTSWSSRPTRWRRSSGTRTARSGPSPTTTRSGPGRPGGGSGACWSDRALQHELVIQADAVAAIIRNKDGKIRTVTNHHAVGAGATWGMFWGMLFGMLFFVPFLGMAVGAGMGALMGKVTKSAVDKQFQDQVREMLQPGTSALFMVLEKVTPDKAVEAMSKFGGTVLKSSLSNEAQQHLQEELHDQRPRH